MEEVIEKLKPISRCMDKVQSFLALDFLNERLVDVDGPSKSLGRVGILGCFLGMIWGLSVACATFLLWILYSEQDFFLSASKLSMAFCWCFYITAMCTFHLLEFFVTAFFNPNVVSSDSFLVNHSKAYTVAAMIASTEFWLRFWFGSGSTNGYITILGIVTVIVAQAMRSFAMMQCGESFNHYIQVERKDNHFLVMDGIYRYFRHPSYTGFYYWSIGTQLVLKNPISGLLFAVAGWKFFSQRIPYEERSLIRLFGDEYYNYLQRSYVGIPFVATIAQDEADVLVPKDDSTQEGVEIELDDQTSGHEKDE